MRKTFYTSAITMALIVLIGCQKNLDKVSPGNEKEMAANTHSQKVPQSLKEFTQVNLIASTDGYEAARVDARLVNAWGLSSSPGGTIWISSFAGNSFVVNKDGGQVLNPVNIPSPGGATGGLPTGQVFNSSTGFKLPNGNPARFIFAGVDGVISGWNGGANATRKLANPGVDVYTGLAIAADGANTFLYAANFAQGKIDVIDGNWNKVDKSFTDPDLPMGYSPFNVQAIGGKLYVLYAKVGADGRDDKHPGYGVVNIFNTDGSLVKRFTTYGQLNSPWGIAKAPKSFWGSEFDDTPSDAILIGNFGDGHINAYANDGTFLGQLRKHGEPLVIDGLWAIMFPPSTATAVDPNRLYFAAGPAAETQGLFGYIIK